MKRATIRIGDGRERVAVVLDGERRLLDLGWAHERVRGGESAVASMLALVGGLELARFLNPGDVIELEVVRIGVLRNRIIKER